MDKDSGSISKKVEDFLQVFKKGEEFTQELLKENEKLRYKTAKLEELTKYSDRDGTFKVHTLEERIKFLEDENKHLADRFREVERHFEPPTGQGNCKQKRAHPGIGGCPSNRIVTDDVE